MMAQSSYRARSVGDYVVGKQLGFGSFSVVWLATHKVHGTEVAIKEILTGKLTKKLEESLMSEIDILRNINHPNIIRLLDMIKEPSKIYLVLEYCKGGDLSKLIQGRQGRIPKSKAVHFMQQLATGLKVLRDNQIIHRDLKPQNLLLSTADENSTLKIADFGFARSLQDENLAETLCGSPLYMAPEIMLFHKYDAKADLWSVGAILFQLVTGRTPFTGNNQVQLLRNIMKSTELQFPPDVKDLSYECIDLCRKLLRKNPVERLTFAEFFTHPFFTQTKPDELLRDRRRTDEFFTHPFFTQTKPDELLRDRRTDEFTYPKIPAFKIKEENPSAEDNSHVLDRIPPLRSTYVFDLNAEVDASKESTDHNTRSSVEDSLEFIDQDYVIVSGHSGDTASSLSSVCNMSQNIHLTSPPVIGGADRQTASFESSHGSVDLIDASEQPLMARIKSLHDCASAISELVNDKVEAGESLEAISLQLVILAIWKQALDICHTQAAAYEETSTTKTNNREFKSADVSCQVERIFLGEVENAEQLAKITILPGNVGMPDAMETIFQAALSFGRHGAVDECMGYTENAAEYYAKAVRLLSFLVVEAPSLSLNPRFSITNSDRYRLRTYIDVLNNRQSHSRSQRIALLKGVGHDHHHSPSA